MNPVRNHKILDVSIIDDSYIYFQSLTNHGKVSGF